MRRAVLLLLVLAAGLLALIVGRGSDPGGGAASGAAPRTEPVATAIADGQGPTPDAAGPDRVELPATGSDTAPQRFQYRLIDARTSAPLAGAGLRAARSGIELATTDADGVAELIDCDVTDVVFAAPGYLLEFYSLGSQGLARLREHSPAGVYEIPLHHDDYSLPLRLQFVRGDGSAPSAVRLRLRCVDAALPEVDDLPGLLLAQERRPASIVEAWHRHAMAAMLWGMAAEPLYHFGASSNHVVFRVAAEVELRFAAGGVYELEAVTTAGEFGSARVHVAAGAPGPVRVTLTPGAQLAGLVVSAGTPVAGASVRTQPPTLAAGETTTDAAGRFKLAALPPTPLTLVVDHARFEPRTVTAQPGSDGLRIELQARPRRLLEGSVRSRGRGTAIAGARLSTRDNGRVDGESTTAADGGFAIETTLENPELWVVADGFLDYVEVPDPGVTHVECELLPASIDARVSAGLSAAITGIVLTADGKPRNGATVRLVTEQTAPWGGLPGRRILRGGLLRPQHTALTDGVGRFTLECTVAGAVRITAADGSAASNEGLDLAIRPGSRHDDLVLRATR